MNTKHDKPKRVPPAGASNWLNHELGNAQFMVQPVGGTRHWNLTGVSPGISNRVAG